MRGRGLGKEKPPFTFARAFARAPLPSIVQRKSLKNLIFTLPSLITRTPIPLNVNSTFCLMEIDRDKKSSVSFTHPSTVSLWNKLSREITTKLSGIIGISPREEKDNWGGGKEVEITTRTHDIHLQIIIWFSMLKNRIVNVHRIVRRLVVPNVTLFLQLTTRY